MADDTTQSSGTATETETETQETGTAELGDAGKKALDAERSRAKAAERRAKELETQLDDFKRSQMTDQEKAIDEAKAQARAEALAEAGAEIAAAQFRAAVAGRLDEEQLTVLLEGLDPKAFTDAEGRVDADKIQSFVDRVVPEQRRTTDFGQGARNTNTALNGDPLLRDVKSKLGIG